MSTNSSAASDDLEKGAGVARRERRDEGGGSGRCRPLEGNACQSLHAAPARASTSASPAVAGRGSSGRASQILLPLQLGGAPPSAACQDRPATVLLEPREHLCLCGPCTDACCYDPTIACWVCRDAVLRAGPRHRDSVRLRAEELISWNRRNGCSLEFTCKKPQMDILAY
ncbi:hypothetical protein EJB05_52217, partial [Eragrostis curvula]